MSNTKDKPSNASDQDSPTDQPKKGVMTVNMTYARLALLLVALNLLFTGYAIVKLDGASSEAPPEVPARMMPTDYTQPPEGV